MIAALAVPACSANADDSGTSTSAPTGDRPSTSTSVVDPAEIAAGIDPAEGATSGANPSPSAGCEARHGPASPPAPPPSGDTAATIHVAGTDRTYRLGVPADGGRMPVPLVVNLHGSGSNAEQQSVYSQMAVRATARGWITVAPDAGDGRWDFTADGDDMAFVLALLDDVQARLCVDLNRIHVAGMSLGAWFAAVVACNQPERIASAALVTVEVVPGGCEPLPVVAFHGTADRVVPYGEGGDPTITVVGPNAALPGFRQNLAGWAAIDGCDPDARSERVGDDVERVVYDGCDPGAEVVGYSIDGGGHTWPGASIEIGQTTRTIDATEIALDWFAAHPLRR